jgi:putative phage-type endonuclease
VLGLSPWRSPLELFLEKTGHGSAQVETLPMRVGKALEPVVLDQFSERTGLGVTQQQQQFIDPLFAWRWATVDGIASDGNLVEAKTTGSDRDWGAEGSDQIPLHYVVQVQHALAVTGFELAWVPVLFEARDFRIYQVKRDAELIAAITERETAFWQRVLDNNPPDAITVADLRLRYAKDIGTSVIADEACIGRVTTLRDMQTALKDAETQAEQVKAELMAYMGEAATLVSPDGQVVATWKTSKGREYLDGKALKNDWPELYQKFLKEAAPSRPFRLK